MLNELTLAAASVASGEKINIGDAAVTAVFGYAVVFVGLISLMIVISIIGAIFKSKDAKAAAAKAAEEASKPAENAAPAEAPKLAPGSAGHVKLFDVPDKEAAMIMAIVADKMQKPLNELHFISIKEVK
ncbi:MAG: hypothetical protein E7497_03980 [Ruminococcus sp.]|nr:hypothetical protein [Ruminococcus sp.]